MANPAYINAKPDPKPGSRGYFRWYWTVGPGLKLWITSPHPWTALYLHLTGKVPALYLDATVSAWYHAVTGHWPGERGGKNPIGPG